MNRTREVHFSKNQSIRLTKRFCKDVDKIMVRPFGKGASFALPVMCIDYVVQALLELKVLMADGSEYNSGYMRAALIDGSGREVAVEDLLDNGCHNAVFQARSLIEEIEDAKNNLGENDDEE